MEKRCSCKVGYISMSDPVEGDRATLLDAQNIRLTKGVIICASCSSELYQIKLEG